MRFKTFYLLFSLLFISIKSYSQEPSKSIPVTGDWESGGYIVENAEMNVEIEYKLQKESCDPGGFGNANHQFRFKIEAKKKPIGDDRFLSFKLMFEDCFGVKICKTVNLNIGVRQKNDKWDGIQPLADPNGDNSFTARKLLIPFYDANIRWFKDPTKDSECDGLGKIPEKFVAKPKTPQAQEPIKIEEKIKEAVKWVPVYELPKKIEMKSDKLYCVGALVKFFPVGGKLDSLLKYQWTKSTCNGEVVYEGDTLEVMPTESSLYYLKIIGPGITSNCISIDYQLKRIPTERLPFAKLVFEDNQIQIDIDRSSIKGNYPVSWYKNFIDPEHRLATKSYSLQDVCQKGDVYYYRFENACDTSIITEVSFPEIKSKIKTESNTFFQINIGASLGANQKLQPFNAMIVIGSKRSGRGGYVKIKKQQSGTIGTISPTLETNNLKITNYPRNTNTYYVLGSGVSTTRDSYTGGIFYKLGKGNKVSLYLGGGIGNSKVYWNAKTYDYTTTNLALNAKEDLWVKNKTQSYTGIEAEAGIVFTIGGKVNVYGGANMIKESEFIFITSDVGIGYSF